MVIFNTVSHYQRVTINQPGFSTLKKNGFNTIHWFLDQRPSEILLWLYTSTIPGKFWENDGKTMDKSLGNPGHLMV